MPRGILCFKHLSEESKKAAREAQKERVLVQKAERLTQLSDPNWFTQPTVTIAARQTQVRIKYTNSSGFERSDSILCVIIADFYGERNSDGSVPMQQMTQSFLVTSQ